jgi:hypothetical protein
VQFKDAIELLGFSGVFDAHECFLATKLTIFGGGAKNARKPVFFDAQNVLSAAPFDSLEGN